jgi:hypothetical protein
MGHILDRLKQAIHRDSAQPAKRPPVVGEGDHVLENLIHHYGHQVPALAHAIVTCGLVDYIPLWDSLRRMAPTVVDQVETEVQKLVHGAPPRAATPAAVLARPTAATAKTQSDSLVSAKPTALADASDSLVSEKPTATDNALADAKPASDSLVSAKPTATDDTKPATNDNPLASAKPATDDNPYDLLPAAPTATDDTKPATDDNPLASAKPATDDNPYDLLPAAPTATGTTQRDPLAGVSNKPFALPASKPAIADKPRMLSATDDNPCDLLPAAPATETETETAAKPASHEADDPHDLLPAEVNQLSGAYCEPTDDGKEEDQSSEATSTEAIDATDATVDPRAAGAVKLDRLLDSKAFDGKSVGREAPETTPEKTKYAFRIAYRIVEIGAERDSELWNALARLDRELFQLIVRTTFDPTTKRAVQAAHKPDPAIETNATAGMAIEPQREPEVKGDIPYFDFNVPDLESDSDTDEEAPTTPSDGPYFELASSTVEDKHETSEPASKPARSARFVSETNEGAPGVDGGKAESPYDEPEVEPAVADGKAESPYDEPEVEPAVAARPARSLRFMPMDELDGSEPDTEPEASESESDEDFEATAIVPVTATHAPAIENTKAESPYDDPEAEPAVESPYDEPEVEPAVAARPARSLRFMPMDELDGSEPDAEPEASEIESDEDFEATAIAPVTATHAPAIENTKAKSPYADPEAEPESESDSESEESAIESIDTQQRDEQRKEQRDKEKEQARKEKLDKQLAELKKNVIPAKHGRRAGEGVYTKQVIDGKARFEQTDTTTADEPTEMPEVIGKRGALYEHEEKVAAFPPRNMDDTQAAKPSAAIARGKIDRTVYMDEDQRAAHSAETVVRTRPRKKARIKGIARDTNKARDEDTNRDTAKGSDESKNRDEDIGLDAKVVFVRDGARLDSGKSTTAAHAGGRFIFVLSTAGVLYLADAAGEGDALTQLLDAGKGDGLFIHHTSFLAGGDVKAAGDIQIHKGKVVALSNQSGHYKMDSASNTTILKHLLGIGVDIKNVRVDTFDGDKHCKTPVRSTAEAVFESDQNYKQLTAHDEVMSSIRDYGGETTEAGAPDMLLDQATDIGRDAGDALNAARRADADKQLMREVVSSIKSIDAAVELYLRNPTEHTTTDLAIANRVGLRAIETLRRSSNQPGAEPASPGSSRLDQARLSEAPAPSKKDERGYDIP